MMLTQQWRYLNLTRNSFYILLPAKGIVNYRQIISIRLYVRLKVSTFVYKELIHLLAKHF